MPASTGKRDQPTVADFVVDRLLQWNVRRVFGYPGDGIDGVLGAMNRRDGAIEFLQVAHEELASLMATAHAEFTGRT
jgi:pyruvate dehydrogenase (quinone)